MVVAPIYGVEHPFKGAGNAGGLFVPESNTHSSSHKRLTTTSFGCGIEAK